MEKLEFNTLVEINGGAVSSSMITSVVRAVNTIISFGTKVGSTIRRIVDKKYCQI